MPRSKKASVSELDASNERDRLWRRTFDALYDTTFNQIEVSTYIRILDGVNLIALTLAFVAGGSSGLTKFTVWKSGGGEGVWITLLVIAGLSGGVRVATGLGHKLPSAQSLVAEIVKLKHDLEELISVMRADPEFSIPAVRAKYSKLMKRCRVLEARCPVSILLPTWLRKGLQKQTDQQLASLIDQGHQNARLDATITALSSDAEPRPKGATWTETETDPEAKTGFL